MALRLVSSLLFLWVNAVTPWQLNGRSFSIMRRQHVMSTSVAATKDDDSNSNEKGNKFSPFGRTGIEHGPHQRMKQQQQQQQQQVNGEKKQQESSTVVNSDAMVTTTTTFADTNMMKRDRALLALHSNLKLDMVDAIHLLDQFPKLYLDCPSLATRLLYLLQELGLSKKKVRHLLQVHPRLMVRVLLDDPETNVSSTVQILQTELHMSLEEIMAKKLWHLDRMEMRPRLSLLRDLIPSTATLKSICLKHPHLLGGVTQQELQGTRQTTVSNMKQIVKLLQQQEDGLQLDQDQVGEMIGKQPSLLLEDPTRIQQQLQFLLHGAVGEGLGMVLRRGVSTKHLESTQEQQTLVLQRVQELLLRFPVLLMSPNVMRTVDYLVGLGCSTYDLGRIAYRRPKLFQYEMEALQEKVDYFTQQLELSDNRAPLMDMMATAPDVFTQSVSANLDPKLTYFRHTLELDTANLRLVLLQRPQILSLSLQDNLIPKIRYLLDTLGMTRDHVRKMITLFPQVLRESLETRIRPRCQLLLQLGVRCPDPVPLDFLQMTDAQWKTWVAAGFDKTRFQEISKATRKTKGKKATKS